MRCRLSPSPSPPPPSSSPSPSPAPLQTPPAILLPPLLTTTGILSSIALTVLIINYLLPKLCPASTDEPPLPPPLPAIAVLPAVEDAGKKTISSIPVTQLAKEEKLQRLSYGECSVCRSALEEGNRCAFCSARGGFAFDSIACSAVLRWWRRFQQLRGHRRRAIIC